MNAEVTNATSLIPPLFWNLPLSSVGLLPGLASSILLLVVGFWVGLFCWFLWSVGLLSGLGSSFCAVLWFSGSLVCVKVGFGSMLWGLRLCGVKALAQDAVQGNCMGRKYAADLGCCYRIGSKMWIKAVVSLLMILCVISIMCIAALGKPCGLMHDSMA